MPCGWGENMYCLVFNIYFCLNYDKHCGICLPTSFTNVLNETGKRKQYFLQGLIKPIMEEANGC